MQTNHKPKVQSSKSLQRIILVSLPISVIGFIILYLPDTFPFEFRGIVFNYSTNGFLAFVSLFICLSAIMILLMRRDNWLSGFVMLMFPLFLLLPVAFMAFLTLCFPGNRWTDDITYTCQNEYIIKQSGYDGDFFAQRIIKTSSPHAAIRGIALLTDTTLNRQLNDTPKWFVYAGKIWHKLGK